LKVNKDVPKEGRSHAADSPLKEPLEAGPAKDPPDSSDVHEETPEPKKRKIDTSKDQCGILYWKGKKVAECRKLPHSSHIHHGRVLTPEEIEKYAKTI
jgi:hypothetical protein